jgi:hypothetical protein
MNNKTNYLVLVNDIILFVCKRFYNFNIILIKTQRIGNTLSDQR